MKTLLIITAILLSFQINGQTKKTKSIEFNPKAFVSKADTPFISTSAFAIRTSSSKEYELMIGSPRSNEVISFWRDGKVTAYNNLGSDTLFIIDTLIELYQNKIRYIKIGDKVYPLKP